MKRTLVLVLALAVLSGPVKAATVAFLNMPPRECPSFQQIAADLNAVRFPADWKVYIACSDVAWKQVQARGDVNGTEAAYTSRAKKFTVVNATMYFPGFSFDGYSQKTPQGALRHELGHITCDTADEKTADRYANTGACK